jgi:hypothetical protein
MLRISLYGYQKPTRRYGTRVKRHSENMNVKQILEEQLNLRFGAMLVLGPSTAVHRALRISG